MIDIDFTDIIRTQFRIDMRDVHTAIPCTVVNIVNNMQEQRVDVLPAVNDLLKDGTEEPGMQILGVPVIFPGSSTSLISFPINVGDTVLCIFSQRSMDNFKIGNGQPTKANDMRRFSDQDAVAIPGLFPFAKSLNRPTIRKFPFDANRDLCMTHNVASGTECAIILKQNGNVEVHTDKEIQFKAGTKISFEAPAMEINVANTTWTGNYSITGIATFNGIPFNTHKHLGVTTGTGTSGVPTA